MISRLEVFLAVTRIVLFASLARSLLDNNNFITTTNMPHHEEEASKPSGRVREEEAEAG